MYLARNDRIAEPCFHVIGSKPIIEWIYSLVFNFIFIFQFIPCVRREDVANTITRICTKIQFSVSRDPAQENRSKHTYSSSMEITNYLVELIYPWELLLWAILLLLCPSPPLLLATMEEGALADHHDCRLPAI
jgi:hypothetical protein